MTKQAARKFIFIGRSGLNKKPARRLLKNLEDSDVKIQLIRGDVGNYEDVQKRVDAVNGPIEGVVQTAMRLDVRIYSTSQQLENLVNTLYSSRFLRQCQTRLGTRV